MPVISYTIIVFAVVLRIKTIKIFPWMNNRTFLQVFLLKQGIQFPVMPAFISICPKDDGRMVYIMPQHLFNQFGASWGVVMTMPACQLIHYV
ncbi:hypothetical protein D3C86_2075430 [compost metagenome]